MPAQPFPTTLVRMLGSSLLKPSSSITRSAPVLTTFLPAPSSPTKEHKVFDDGRAKQDGIFVLSSMEKWRERDLHQFLDRQKGFISSLVFWQSHCFPLPFLFLLVFYTLFTTFLSHTCSNARLTLLCARYDILPVLYHFLFFIQDGRAYFPLISHIGEKVQAFFFFFLSLFDDASA